MLVPYTEVLAPVPWFPWRHAAFGQFAAFMRERLTAMERLQEPFKQLYDNLTPDQRKALDQVFAPKRFRA